LCHTQGNIICIHVIICSKYLPVLQIHKGKTLKIPPSIYYGIYLIHTFLSLFDCTCDPQFNVTDDATMGTVTGLSPFTVYSCTIFAVTVAGGPVSDPLVVTTAEGGKNVVFLDL